MTLAALAKALGITYERLAQFRRGESDISKASRATLSAAASFLSIPMVAVLLLSGALRSEDFVWPDKGSRRVQMEHELDQLRRDPMLAGFVPGQLRQADVEVQRLVAVLYREVVGAWPRTSTLPRWLHALQLASMGNLEAEIVLARLREMSAEDDGAL